MAETQLTFGEIFGQFKAPLIGTILLILFQAGLTFIAINTLQPEVPLFNNQLLAEKSLAPKIWLAVLPSLSIINSLISVILLTTCRSLGKTILQIFAWSSMAFNGILFLALIRIILLVT